MYNINNLASRRLVFKEKNEPFLFENASNLTHVFFMTILTRKFFFSETRSLEEKVLILLESYWPLKHKSINIYYTKIKY